MPKIATGVDFIAGISPRVLAEADAILIDGERREITSVLPNAVTVEVILSETSRRAPVPGIEEYCLPQTRKLIAEQRRLANRDAMVKFGKEILEEVLSDRGLLVLTDLGDMVRSMYYRFGCRGYENFCFMVGNGSIGLEEVRNELDERGVNKEKLGLSSVRLVGIDGPRRLIGLISMVSDRNGNIVHIEESKNGSKFRLRVVIEGLSEKDEKEIRKMIEGDDRFETAILV